MNLMTKRMTNTGRQQQQPVPIILTRIKMWRKSSLIWAQEPLEE